MILFLSWVVLLAAISLMGLKLWSWWDTYKDWRAIQARIPQVLQASAIYRQARGFVRLSWLRVIDGFMWLGLAGLTFYNRHVTPPPSGYPPSLGRIIMLLLIGMELTKLLNDRYTRREVVQAVVEATLRNRRQGDK